MWLAAARRPCLLPGPCTAVTP